MARATRSSTGTGAPHTANEAASSMLISEVNAKTQLHDDEAGGLDNPDVKAKKSKARSKKDSEAKPKTTKASEIAESKSKAAKSANTGEKTPVTSAASPDDSGPHINDAPAETTHDTSKTPKPKSKNGPTAKGFGGNKKNPQSKGEDESRVTKSGAKPKPRQAKQKASAPKTTDEKESSMLVSELNAKFDKGEAAAKRDRAEEDGTEKSGKTATKSQKSNTAKADNTTEKSKGNGTHARKSQENSSSNGRGRHSKKKEAAAAAKDPDEYSSNTRKSGKPSKYGTSTKNKDKYKPKKTEIQTDKINNADATEENDLATPADLDDDEPGDVSVAVDESDPQPSKASAGSSKSKPKPKTTNKPKSAPSDTPEPKSQPAQRAKRSKRVSAPTKPGPGSEVVASKTTDEKESSMLISEHNAKMDKRDAAAKRGGDGVAQGEGKDKKRKAESITTAAEGEEGSGQMEGSARVKHSRRTGA